MTAAPPTLRLRLAKYAGQRFLGCQWADLPPRLQVVCYEIADELLAIMITWSKATKEATDGAANPVLPEPGASPAGAGGDEQQEGAVTA